MRPSRRKRDPAPRRRPGTQRACAGDQRLALCGDWRRQGDRDAAESCKATRRTRSNAPKSLGSTWRPSRCASPILVAPPPWRPAKSPSVRSSRHRPTSSGRVSMRSSGSRNNREAQGRSSHLSDRPPSGRRRALVGGQRPSLPRRHPVSPALVGALAQRFGERCVVADPDRCARYAGDWSSLSPQTPELVVRPETDRAGG